MSSMSSSRLAPSVYSAKIEIKHKSANGLKLYSTLPIVRPVSLDAFQDFALFIVW